MILEKNFTAFTRLLPVREPDGRGGSVTVWRIAETVDAAAIPSQSPHGHANKTVTTHADAPDAKAAYSLMTRRAVSLPFHAVLRREKDGRIFRILSDAADTETPAGARLDLRMYAAEEWKLTGETEAAT